MSKINVHRILFLFLFLFLFSLTITGYAKPVKPRIAIQKPDISSEISDYLKKIINTSAFQSELEHAIQATGKFDILSRQKSELKTVLAEQAFSDSELSSGQAAEKGQLAAANLIVVSEIQSFRFHRKSIPIPNIDNKYRRKDSGSLIVAVKIMDTTTGGIKRSFILQESFVNKQKIANNTEGLPHRSNLEKMYKKVAVKMSNELIDTIFPMLVIQVKGNSVFINRGKDSGLKKDEKLVVYHAGEALIDPYTGESLGSSEEELGVLKVVDVRPKFTIATPVDKVLLDQISPKDIVRKPSN